MTIDKVNTFHKDFVIKNYEKCIENETEHYN